MTQRFRIGVGITDIQILQRGAAQQRRIIIQPQVEQFQVYKLLQIGDGGNVRDVGVCQNQIFQARHSLQPTAIRDL